MLKYSRSYYVNKDYKLNIFHVFFSKKLITRFQKKVKSSRAFTSWRSLPLAQGELFLCATCDESSFFSVFSRLANVLRLAAARVDGEYFRARRTPSARTLNTDREHVVRARRVVGSNTPSGQMAFASRSYQHRTC